jgi:carbon-monoxide dehydrogenase medium subunit
MYPTHPAPFALHRPGTLAEATALLTADGDAKALAGGHSLIPALKLRLASPSALVDLSRIAGLEGIALEGDELVIGALTTHAAVARSETVAAACPVLAEAAGMIGDRQVRNRGTIGGSLGHADPGADYPTVVTALEATVSVTGPGGTRSVAAADLITGVFSTSLAQGELITAVRVPVTSSGTGAAYVKHAHPASGYAVASAAAVLAVEGGACSAATLVVGGASGMPVAVDVGSLVGGAVTADAIAAATSGVGDALGETLGDAYASPAYRRHLGAVVARRALAAAASRTG